MNPDEQAILYLQLLLAMFVNTEAQCGKPTREEADDGLRRGGYWEENGDRAWLLGWIWERGLLAA